MKIKFTPTNLLAALMLLDIASATNVFQGGRDKTDNGSQNIVGGEVAPVGRYTHTVALANNGFQYCGGSLIAPDVVLTAAHCMDGSAFDVYINRHDKLSNQGESIRRIKETKHPNFDSDSLDNDFAVVILSSATTQDVDFVTLNTDEAYPADGATSRAMGWGTTSSGGSSSQLLQWVDLPIISNQECSNRYSGGITSSMICTFLPTKDSCQGDSGGPLIIPGNTAAEDTLIGVVSWGIGCATSTYPGVYGRVSNAYDWIKETACKDSQYSSALCGTRSPVTSQPTAPSRSPTSSPTSILSTQFTKKEEVGYCQDSASEWYSAFKSTPLPLSTSDVDCLRWCTQPGAVDAESLVSVDVLRDGNSVTCYCNYPGGGVPDDIDMNDFTPAALGTVIYSGDGPVVTTDGTSGASCYVNNNFGQTPLVPSDKPSLSPSLQISDSPSDAPSIKPSLSPSFVTSESPSDLPSEKPTLSPSVMASVRPSSVPSETPSYSPTAPLSLQPSGAPSEALSNHPSAKISNSPSDLPSDKPTLSPSIMVSDSPSSIVVSSMPSETPSSSPTSLSHSCPPKGKKVKLQSLTGTPIAVFEVEVFSSGFNVALGKRARQSSNYLGKGKFAASKAVDGNKLTFSHTNKGRDCGWWELDINDTTQIDSIKITNRWCGDETDSKQCLCRLSFVAVSILDGQGRYVDSTLTGNTCGVQEWEHVFTSSQDHCDSA